MSSSLQLLDSLLAFNPLAVGLGTITKNGHSMPPNHCSGMPRVRCQVSAPKAVSADDSLSHPKGVNPARVDRLNIASERSILVPKDVTSPNPGATRESVLVDDLNVPAFVKHFIHGHVSCDLAYHPVLYIVPPIFHLIFSLESVQFQQCNVFVTC